MKYKVENKKGQVLIKFSIDAKEWDSAIEGAYQKTKGKYNMPGFRKGKVPRKVLENAYGKGIFFEDAFNLVSSQPVASHAGRWVCKIDLNIIV